MPPLSTTYIVDTCSFLRLKDTYPLELFGSLWSFMSGLAANGPLESIDLVYDELKPVDDEVLQWAKNHQDIFLPLSDGIQEEAIKVLNEFSTRFVSPKNRKDGADPFVVGAAMHHDAIVVTQEKPTRNNSGTGRVRMPDVCKHYDVECITLLDMLQREGLRL